MGFYFLPSGKGALISQDISPGKCWFNASNLQANLTCPAQRNGSFNNNLTGIRMYPTNIQRVRFVIISRLSSLNLRKNHQSPLTLGTDELVCRVFNTGMDGIDSVSMLASIGFLPARARPKEERYPGNLLKIF